MARLALASVGGSRLGVDVTVAALTSLGANTGISFPSDGVSAALINNGSASPITATLNIAGKVDGAAATPWTVSIPAGKCYMIGPFSKAAYTQSDGNVYVDVSASASVSAAVIHLSPVA